MKFLVRMMRVPKFGACSFHCLVSIASVSADGMDADALGVNARQPGVFLEHACIKGGAAQAFRGAVSRRSHAAE